MEARESTLSERLQTGFLGFIAFALLLVMLVQAQFLLICLCISVIIFSLTSDAISAFARLKVPNWLATVLALLMITVGLLWLTTTLAAQINEIVSTAVTYSEKAQQMLPDLLDWMGPKSQSAVETVIASFNVSGWIRSLASQASNMMSAVILILTFVGFMFAERYWFPIKIERLAGSDERAIKVLTIINSIMRRVNRYLVVKAIVSSVTATLVWVIFRAAGLDLAGPIAMLTLILNFIPTIGSIMATIIAILLVLAQTANVSETVVVGLACTTVHFCIGNIIEPMLLGQTLRMSSFGIVLSLAVWGAVWGLAGMFLSVPIMAAVMIICAHIPWLRPVAIILSREGQPDDVDEPSSGDDQVMALRELWTASNHAELDAARKAGRRARKHR